MPEPKIEPQKRKPLWREALPYLVVTAVIVAALAPLRGHLGAFLPQSPPILRAPDWALFAVQSLQLKIHVAAATLAFLIGVIILLRRKGTGSHRVLGWTWAAAIVATAASSFFITELNGDFYSLIHLLSGWTLIVLPMALVAIRRGNVKRHRQYMLGIFFGGVVVAGAFAFLPGRFMYHFLLGS